MLTSFYRKKPVILKYGLFFVPRSPHANTHHREGSQSLPVIKSSFIYFLTFFQTFFDPITKGKQANPTTRPVKNSATIEGKA